MKRLCTILGLGLILAIAGAGTLVVLLLDSQKPGSVPVWSPYALLVMLTIGIVASVFQVRKNGKGDVPVLILATIVWLLIVWSVLEVTVF